MNKRRSAFIPTIETINVCRDLLGPKHKGWFEDRCTEVSVLWEAILSRATIKVEETLMSVEACIANKSKSGAM